MLALSLAGLALLPALARAAATGAEPRDLDIAERRERAKRELGAKAPTALVGGTFVLSAPPGHGAGLRASADFAENILAALVNGRFRSAPVKPVSVVLFFDAPSYERYCKSTFGEGCISRFGFFRSDVRAIVMNAGPGLGTLSHELVHPFVEHDFPTAPTWLNEGIASLYEAPALGKKGEIRGVKNWRHPRLLNALRTKSEREHARLDVLFGMSDDTFRGDREDLNYALARYVCQWLESQGKLWPFYAKFRDTVATDKSGRDAFSAVMEKTPTELAPAFEKWVKVL